MVLYKIRRESYPVRCHAATEQRRLCPR